MKSFIQTALLCLLLVKLSNCQNEAILPNVDEDIYLPRCPINETVPEGCGSSCGPTCQNRNPVIQNCKFNCAQCVCKPNYLRDEITGNCILEKDCPVPITEESPCPENSIVIDSCAAEECVYHYPFPVDYAQADVAQEAQLVKQPVQSDLVRFRPFCYCIPECKCLPDYVMYNQQCVLRKIKPITRRPPLETIGPIYTIGPIDPIYTIGPVYPVEYLSQKVASESRQHHERKHHNREKHNKKRHHTEKHNKKNNHH